MRAARTRPHPHAARPTRPRRQAALQSRHVRKRNGRNHDRYKILNFIDGEYVATDKWYENRNPINNKVIGMVAEAGEKEVDAAVKAAKAALKGPWGSMSLQKRIELLEALVVEINNRFDDFLEAECADTGKPKSMASHVDIPAARPTSRSSRTWSRTSRPSSSR